MASTDERIMIGKIVEAIQSQITDLELEIGEVGTSYSSALDKAEEILKNTTKQLAALIP